MATDASAHTGAHAAALTPAEHRVIGNFLEDLVRLIERHAAPPPE